MACESAKKFSLLLGSQDDRFLIATLHMDSKIIFVSSRKVSNACPGILTGRMMTP